MRLIEAVTFLIGMITRRRYDARTAATIIEDLESEEDATDSDASLQEENEDASDVETGAGIIHPHGDSISSGSSESEEEEEDNLLDKNGNMW